MSDLETFLQQEVVRWRSDTMQDVRHAVIAAGTFVAAGAGYTALHAMLTNRSFAEALPDTVPVLPALGLLVIYGMYSAAKAVWSDINYRRCVRELCNAEGKVESNDSS